MVEKYQDRDHGVYHARVPYPVSFKTFTSRRNPRIGGIQHGLIRNRCRLDIGIHIHFPAVIHGRQRLAKTEVVT